MGWAIISSFIPPSLYSISSMEGSPISTVTASTVSSLIESLSNFMPDNVSNEISLFAVSPYSYKYLPIQRLAFPHIRASEPSALNIRILKSAIFDLSIRTNPSLPIPVCGLLQMIDFSSGFAIGYLVLSTYM